MNRRPPRAAIKQRDLTIHANAKINLRLEVGPLRRDGYHSLKTVFQEVTLHDTLVFRLHSDRVRLRCSTKSLDCGPSNLIVRALNLLRQEIDEKRGMSVHLAKRIPMGAGLGGGSSDAAAALWGGWILWTQPSAKGGLFKRPRRIPPVLLKCARQLGADVTFFLRGGRCFASGIGEKLIPQKPGPKRWLVLVYPRAHVSTKLAYSWLDELRERNGRALPGLNSFEAAVFPRFPVIQKVKQDLISLGCKPAMMSGSGSTVFGFVKNRRSAQRVIRQLGKNKWDFYLAHTL